MGTKIKIPEFNGHGKQNYYWNENEEIVECWAVDDPDMPEWLKQYIP